MGNMTRDPLDMTDDAGQANLSFKDARTYAQRLIDELDGLDDPADERRFVEAIVQATGLDSATVIIITSSDNVDSSESLSERVLLPPTEDRKQLEIVRRMLAYGDDRREGAVPRHESPIEQSAEPATQHSIQSRWDQFRDWLTALW